MAIVLLVKTFYTQITIRCTMTTEKKNQSNEVMSWDGNMQYYSVNSIRLLFCHPFSAPQEFISSNIKVHLCNAESVHVEEVLWNACVHART